MKSAHLLRLQAVAALIRHREELTDDELVELLKANLGRGRSPAAQRAKRYRDAKRAHKRDERHGQALRKRDEPSRENVTNVTPERDERHVSASLPSSPPTPPSDSYPSDLAKEYITTAKDPNRLRARETAGVVVLVPRNLEDSLRIGLSERAQACFAADQRGDSFRAQAMCPHDWPELQELAEHFRAATGLEHVQAGPWPNATTKRLVELLAVHPPATIRGAFDALPESSWWEDPAKRRLGLAGISPRVLEGLLTERGEQRLKRSTRELVRRAREAGAIAPESLGATLGRVVSGGRE